MLYRICCPAKHIQGRKSHGNLKERTRSCFSKTFSSTARSSSNRLKTTPFAGKTQLATQDYTSASTENQETRNGLARNVQVSGDDAHVVFSRYQVFTHSSCRQNGSPPSEDSRGKPTAQFLFSLRLSRIAESGGACRVVHSLYRMSVELLYSMMFVLLDIKLHTEHLFGKRTNDSGAEAVPQR